MVIIRRNPDGTIAQESQTKAPPRHPALSFLGDYKPE